MKRSTTATFLLELPLQVDSAQACHLHAHLEVARTFYNALLGEAQKRLRRMRADPAWQAARALPRRQKQERAAAFTLLRHTHHFSEYDLHQYAKTARVSWMAEHLDSTMAQTLASRAYHTVNRVCLGKAKQVRFKSKGRGIDSVEGKRNDVGLRFVLDPGVGDGGFLIWNQQVLAALIDWRDPVIQHGLRHPIKYVRLVRRMASSSQAKGAGRDGKQYFVQLILAGHAFQKPKHEPGCDTVGLDIGPSTLAIVPREGEARLVTFCDALEPNAQKKRRVQRHMERQRRANNPDNYDAKGRVKKGRRPWNDSRRSQATRRQYARAERRLAAHRKSLHGKLAHEIIAMGTTIRIEKTSFKGWQKRYGKSSGRRAPGLFVAQLERLVAKTGGTLKEVSPYHTKLSQYCHGCHTYRKKPLSQRWHRCTCGIGPVQRDLYSAFLLAFLDLKTHTPSITRPIWEGAEPRLHAVIEGLQQRANEGQSLPRSMGVLASRKAPRARARRLKSPVNSQQEPISPQRETGSVG
jgi:transposase